jgi:hypothetical protein
VYVRDNRGERGMASMGGDLEIYASRAVELSAPLSEEGSQGATVTSNRRGHSAPRWQVWGRRGRGDPVPKRRALAVDGC